MTSRTISRALLSCALASSVTLLAAAQTSSRSRRPQNRAGPKTKPAPPAEKKPAPAPTPPPPRRYQIHTKSISGAQVTETGCTSRKWRQRFDFPGSR